MLSQNRNFDKLYKNCFYILSKTEILAHSTNYLKSFIFFKTKISEKMSIKQKF